MGCINGVFTCDMEDDCLDYRDDESLWLWPNGYGQEPCYELHRNEVLQMLRGFDQEFAGDTFFDKLRKRLRNIKEAL